MINVLGLRYASVASIAMKYRNVVMYQLHLQVLQEDFTKCHIRSHLSTVSQSGRNSSGVKPQYAKVRTCSHFSSSSFKSRYKNQLVLFFDTFVRVNDVSLVQITNVFNIMLTGVITPFLVAGSLQFTFQHKYRSN